jgi:hypothetical protein
MENQVPDELESLSLQYANMSNQEHYDTNGGMSVADNNQGLDRISSGMLLEPRTNTTFENDVDVSYGKSSISAIQTPQDLKVSDDSFGNAPKAGIPKYTKTGRISKSAKGKHGAHICDCGKVSLLISCSSRLRLQTLHQPEICSRPISACKVSHQI